MPIIASNEGGNFALPPAGTQIARCFMLVDLGTQNTEFQGQAKRQRKVRIGFELPNEKHVFNEEKGEEPFTLSKEYTCILSDKSNLKKDLESWRGRPFTSEEMKGFDISKLLGAAATISIVHKPSKDGSKMFANIASISPVMKGMKCPPAILEPVLYEISNGKDKTFSRLPEWIQKTVEKAEEFNDAPPAHAAPEAPETEPEEEDIPF